MAVRRVFCSYLSLLVNSKNDMALALTLNVPCRSLERQAFTDIKRAARDRQTSLFLVRKSTFISSKTQYRVVLVAATFGGFFSGLFRL